MSTKGKLGEYIDIVRGTSLPGIYYATEGNLIRLTLGNFDYQNGGFKENTSKDNIYYSGDVAKEFILKKDDIITPLTEQTAGLIGSTAKIPESGKYILSQDVALIKCKEGKLYPSYCYYLVSSDYVKKQLAAGAQQTKIRHTSPDKIKRVLVEVPEYDEQIRVGDFLASLDNKIKINSDRIVTLEKMADTVFNYWFLSNQQSAWPRQHLSDFFDVVTGKKDANYATEDGKYPFFTCSQQALKSPDFSFDGAAILLAGNGDFNIKRYVGKFEAYQRTYVLMPDNPSYMNILYLVIKNYLPDITGSSRGSVIKFITKGHIEDFIFSMPKFDAIENKIKVINAIFEDIDKSQANIKNLLNIKNFLLPKMMTGDLTISR